MTTQAATTTAKKEEAKVAVREEVQTILDGLNTKSAKIRFLNEVGFSRGEISKILNIRYQHVRNVLVTPVKTDNSKELAAKVKKAK